MTHAVQPHNFLDHGLRGKPLVNPLADYLGVSLDSLMIHLYELQIAL